MKVFIRVDEQKKIIFKHYQPEELISQENGFLINDYQDPLDKKGYIAEEYWEDNVVIVKYSPLQPSEQETIRDLQRRIAFLEEGTHEKTGSN